MLNGRAATTAERTAKGAGRAAARTMEEPRVAARNRAADCMAVKGKKELREKRESPFWRREERGDLVFRAF